MEEQRVLVIEDNLDHSKLIAQVLHKELGMVVDTAHRGEDALLHYENHDYRCVLLDFELPGMSGLEILYELKKREPFPPVIMLTGQGSQEIAVEAMKKGAYDYLDKSKLFIGLRKLPSIVQKAIESQEVKYRLRESQERFRQIAQMSNEIIFRVDDNRRWEFFNQNIYTRLGFTAEELANTPMEEYLHPEDRERTLRLFQHALMDGGAVAGFENRLRTSDGSYLKVRWNATPERNTTGQIVGVLCVGSQVEEANHLKEDLDKAEGGLQKIADLMTLMRSRAIRWTDVGNVLAYVTKISGMTIGAIHLRRESGEFQLHLCRGRIRTLKLPRIIAVNEEPFQQVASNHSAVTVIVPGQRGRRKHEPKCLIGRAIRTSNGPIGLLCLGSADGAPSVSRMTRSLVTQLAQIIETSFEFDLLPIDGVPDCRNGSS